MASSAQRRTLKKPTRDGKRDRKASLKEQLQEMREAQYRENGSREGAVRKPVQLEARKPEKMEEGLSEMIWGPVRK